MATHVDLREAREHHKKVTGQAATELLISPADWPTQLPLGAAVLTEGDDTPRAMLRSDANIRAGVIWCRSEAGPVSYWVIQHRMPKRDFVCAEPQWNKQALTAAGRADQRQSSFNEDSLNEAEMHAAKLLAHASRGALLGAAAGYDRAAGGKWEAIQDGSWNLIGEDGRFSTSENGIRANYEREQPMESYGVWAECTSNPSHGYWICSDGPEPRKHFVGSRYAAESSAEIMRHRAQKELISTWTYTVQPYTGDQMQSNTTPKGEQGQLYGVWCTAPSKGLTSCWWHVAGEGPWTGTLSEAAAKACTVRGESVTRDWKYDHKPYPYPSDVAGLRLTVDQLTAEVEKWKAIATSNTEATRYACKESPNTLHVDAKMFEGIANAQKRANQLADHLSFAEYELKNALAHIETLESQASDLRRYVGSKVCARYDALRAKEKK